MNAEGAKEYISLLINYVFPFADMTDTSYFIHMIMVNSLLKKSNDTSCFIAKEKYYNITVHCQRKVLQLQYYSLPLSLVTSSRLANKLTQVAILLIADMVTKMIASDPQANSPAGLSNSFEACTRITPMISEKQTEPHFSHPHRRRKDYGRNNRIVVIAAAANPTPFSEKSAFQLRTMPIP